MRQPVLHSAAGWWPPLLAPQPARLPPSGFELAQLLFQLAHLFVEHNPQLGKLPLVLRKLRALLVNLALVGIKLAQLVCLGGH